MPTQQLTNPEGAFGYTAAGNESTGQLVETYEANGAVTAAEVLFLESDGRVSQFEAGVDNAALAVGIALHDAGDGDTVYVVTRGRFADAKKKPGDDSIAAGAHMRATSATDDGTIESFTPAVDVTDAQDVVAIAVAASDDTNDTVDVYVTGIGL